MSPPPHTNQQKQDGVMALSWLAVMDKLSMLYAIRAYTSAERASEEEIGRRGPGFEEDSSTEGEVVKAMFI